MAKKLLEEFGARFLDPSHVGSSIRWNVNAELTPKGGITSDSEVSMSDCSRVINWSSYGDDRLLLKVQEAIAELKRAEKALKRLATLRAQHGDEDE